MQVQMMTFVWCLCAFGIGVYAGRQFQMWILHRAIDSLIAKESARSYLYDTYVNVEITKEGDSFLLYDSDTQAFLAQGRTPDEVNSILRERFPRTYFTATFENAKEMGYITDERL